MKKQITMILALGLAATAAQAQTAARLEAGKAGMYPASVDFAQGQEPAFVKGRVFLKEQSSFKASDKTILRHSETDQIGQEHFRYQQSLNGIPVENATYVVHVAGGKVKGQNGKWVANAPADLATEAGISEAVALQNAMRAFGAKTYKWQLPSEEKFIKNESGDADATFMPKGELVYYSGEDDVDANNLHLAYKLDLYAQEPIGRRIYFVDATTGAILGKRELLHTSNVVGTATTVYSGTQSINTDKYGNNLYRLRDTTRGLGVQTFNLKQGTTYNNVDFIDSDNIWNNVNATWDQYATDAHWGAEKTYDYYKNTYNRNSINNAGFAIKSYVHYSTNYFNAFWDGSRMTYGDGGTTDGNKPLTALDVCGHEITHGLTSFTANLNYSNESGALNEGFSDCLGTAIEWYGKPSSANWLIGENFYTIRSMSNPNAYGQPDTYLGTNWATGTADNGGVHTNSGVLNYWFYLLSVGGSGTNDKGTAFSVTGITIQKAAAIAYRTLTVYLISTSQYVDARTKSIQAATDLYGATSNEVTQVTNAWNAVGVGAAVVTPACTDTYESNETKATAKAIAINNNITAKIGTATDKDWFSFATTTAAPKLKVTLTNLPADYDLVLYNSAGTQIGISQNGSTTAESISYNTATAGATYYVQVYGYSSAFNASTCYTLRAATGSTNQLVDDGDPNDFIGLNKTGAGIELNDDQVALYPNPAKGQLNLRFTAGDDAQQQQLIITDLVGRVVLSKTISIQKGMNHVQLPIGDYATGMYLLKMEGRQTTKFQVIQ